MALNIQRSTLEPEVEVIAVSGEIDWDTVSGFEDVVQNLFRTNPKVVLADLREVSYLGSAGISELLDLNAQLECRGGRLVVLGKQTGALGALELVGFGEVALIAESMEDALDLISSLRHKTPPSERPRKN